MIEIDHFLHAGFERGEVGELGGFADGGEIFILHIVVGADL